VRLEEDKRLDQQIIEEFQSLEEGYDKISIESFESWEELPKQKSTDIVQKRSSKKSERKESYEKARAWHLERKRDKEKKKKKQQ
jgi:hypothetical protein